MRKNGSEIAKWIVEEKKTCYNPRPVYTSPKVSVLIPVYNQQELIIKALESIPKIKTVEIIVCDDGSTDKTWEAVIKYVSEYRSIRLIQNETNKGVAYTVNRLMNEAQGEYMVLLGSDDYFYTDNFKKAIKELDGKDFIFFQTSNNYGMVELNDHNKCGSFKFMRRRFMQKFKYDENRLAGEDYHLWKKIIKENPTIKILDIMVKHYNYPRENSLNWQINNGLIDLESGAKK